jgi:hypothetical protein
MYFVFPPDPINPGKSSTVTSSLSSPWLKSSDDAVQG